MLFVEDDADIAEGVRQMLQAMGAEVELCAGHDAAMASLAQRDFEVLLCDLRLGDGPDAFELLRRLRTDPRHAPMVAVLLSAHGSAEDQRASLHAGFVRHLVKPVDAERLARTLIEVCDRREPR